MGSSGAGAALEKLIRDDPAATSVRSAREEILLKAAVRQADDIAALEQDVAERGHVIDGQLNPSLREVRQTRVALGRLLAAIDLPNAANTTTLRAERAADARWRRAS